MKITTKSGRIVDTPDIRVSTPTKFLNDTKKANAWILEECKREYKDDDWTMVTLNCMDLKNLSKCDISVLYMLLLPDGASDKIFMAVE
jgi:hypothetical protein